MNKQLSFSRVGLFVLAVLCVLSLTFANFQGGNPSPAFAQDLATATPTAAPTDVSYTSEVPVTDPASTTGIEAESPASPPDISSPEADPTSAVDVTPTPEPVQEEERVQISSQELELTFLAPSDWQVVNGADASTAAGNEEMITMTSPEGIAQIAIISLPNELNASLEEWVVSQLPRLPSEVQRVQLEDNVCGGPTILAFGYTSLDGDILYAFIDRGQDILEVTYRSQRSLAYINKYEDVLRTLNPSDPVVLNDNMVPAMGDLFNFDIQRDAQPQEKPNPKALSDKHIRTATAIKKQLNISYVDQVYAQNKLEGKPNFTDGEKWNWCGPSSVTMALKYFGVLGSTDINQATQNTAGKIMKDGQTLWPYVSSNTKVADYTASFGVKTVTADKLSRQNFISFNEIKQQIDGGKPILMGVLIKGAGHWVLITGYEESGASQIVYIHDPYGNAKWEKLDHRWTGSIWDKPLNVWNPVGKYASYTYKGLSSVKRCNLCWAVFENNPLPYIGNVSPLNVQTGSPDTPITITGSNFVKGAVVMWNGTALKTSYSSSSKLIATIPANFIKSATTASISVFNHLPGGGNSNNQVFTVFLPANPKPSTTALSHRVIAQLGPDLKINVYGSGFVSASRARLNGKDLTTTYVSATQLTAVIPSSLRKGVGSVSISVYSPAPGGGTSNEQKLVKADFYSQAGIVSYHSKKALDLPGGRSDNSIKIQQWTWDRSNNNQKWLLVPTGNTDEFWIISPSTGKCLEIAGGSKDNWANLIQNSCHFGNSQRFKRIKQGSNWLGSLAGKNYSYQNYYSFVSVNSGKYLDVDNWSTQNGALVLQYTPGNKQGNQMWYVLTP